MGIIFLKGFIMRFRHSLIAAALAASALALPATSSATLVLDPSSPLNLQGTGLGTVLTVLTMQPTQETGGGPPTPDAIANGCVSFNGTGNVITGGLGSGGCVTTLTPGDNNDPKTGASQTLTRIVSATTAANAGELAIIFNASEPGNTTANAVTLDSLTMSLYSNAGLLLGSFSTAQAYNFPITLNGIGNAAWLFVLDDAQAAQAVADTAGLLLSGIHVGVSAQVSGGTGAPATFFLTEVDRLQVPEPGTLALLGLGFAAMGLRRRKFNI